MVCSVEVSILSQDSSVLGVGIYLARGMCLIMQNYNPKELLHNYHNMADNHQSGKVLLLCHCLREKLFIYHKVWTRRYFLISLKYVILTITL